ncbi:MAG: hypothetical protein ABIU09_07055 [Pyrinomonadaceae bacterium]
MFQNCFFEHPFFLILLADNLPGTLNQYPQNLKGSAIDLQNLALSIKRFFDSINPKLVELIKMGVFRRHHSSF